MWCKPSSYFNLCVALLLPNELQLYDDIAKVCLKLVGFKLRSLLEFFRNLSSEVITFFTLH